MTTTMDSKVSAAVSALQPISLDALNNVAGLQTRRDRKYVVRQSDLALLVSELPNRLAALDMEGRRHFDYESVYFDTVKLDCYLDAAHKRRQRFKVRTRTYLDSYTTMLEIKTRGGRKTTIKSRQPHAFDGRRTLDDSASAFVDTTIGHQGLSARLAPVLTTVYQRTTLVDLTDVARLTIDDHLRCQSANGNHRTVGIDGHLIVETKSRGAASFADRWLWQHGIRPVKISKFGTGLAALHPELPANKWHRTINRHFRPTS